MPYLQNIDFLTSRIDYQKGMHDIIWYIIKEEGIEGSVLKNFAPHCTVAQFGIGSYISDWLNFSFYT